MQIMYVETCPDCDCVVVRAPTGETKPSRLMEGCTGCGCHRPWRKSEVAPESQPGQPEHLTQIASGN